MSPQRIQRQRTKGWRMPEGAVYVGRPSRWGNPFRVDGPVVYGNNWGIGYLTPEAARRVSVDLFTDVVLGIWNPSNVRSMSDTEYGWLWDDLSAWKRRIGCHPSEAARSELRGVDLACWCGDVPCHADVLLKIANAS